MSKGQIQLDFHDKETNSTASFYEEGFSKLKAGDLKGALENFIATRKLVLQTKPVMDDPSTIMSLGHYDLPIESLQESLENGRTSEQALSQILERIQARGRAYDVGEMIKELHRTATNINRLNKNNLDMKDDFSSLESFRQKLEQKHDVLMKFAFPKSYEKRIEARKAYHTHIKKPI